MQRLAALAVEAHMQPDDDKQFVCFVSLERLAAETGACEKTARAALAAVVEAGYLARARGKAVVRGGKRQGRESRTSYTYALVLNRDAFVEKRDAQRAANLASVDTRRAEKAGELAALHAQLTRLQAAAYAPGNVDADALTFDGARLERKMRDIERYIRGGVPVSKRKGKRGVSTLANKRRERAFGRTAETLAAAVATAAAAHAMPTGRDARRQTEPVCQCGCGAEVMRVNGVPHDAPGGVLTNARHVCRFFPGA